LPALPWRDNAHRPPPAVLVRRPATSMDDL
jgi:hypothetical protein